MGWRRMAGQDKYSHFLALWVHNRGVPSIFLDFSIRDWVSIACSSNQLSKDPLDDFLILLLSCSHTRTDASWDHQTPISESAFGGTHENNPVIFRWVCLGIGNLIQMFKRFQNIYVSWLPQILSDLPRSYISLTHFPWILETLKNMH